MENFEYIERLLQTKDFEELTGEERKLIADQLSQGEYDELRQTINKIGSERIKLQKDLKTQLLKENKKRSAIVNLLLQPMPAYSIIFILFFASMLYIFTPSKVVTKTVISEREVPIIQLDTIFVVKKDTVWRERIIQVSSPPNLLVNKGESLNKTLNTKNKSISNQEELLDLVVRGE